MKTYGGDLDIFASLPLLKKPDKAKSFHTQAHLLGLQCGVRRSPLIKDLYLLEIAT